jgi:hypothetical protein
MKKGSLVRGILILGLTGILSVCARTPPTVTNVWIKSTGGNWSDRSAWSAGRPPAWTHWVAIANPTPKTVEMNASSAQSFPDSLTMSHLLIGTNNTLVIDHIGAPLRIESHTNFWGLEVSQGGKVRSLGSEIHVSPRILVWYNAEFVQDGGLLETSSASLDGISYLTNAVLKTSYLDVHGTLHQHGGSVSASERMRVIYHTYHLYSGEVSAASLSVQNGSFEQKAGLVRTPSLAVGIDNSAAAYLLDGGDLNADSVHIVPFMSHASFEHNGGVAVITNVLNLRGSARYYPPMPTYAEYLGDSNAVLSARTVQFDQREGSSWFESAGRATISGNIEFIGDPIYRGNLFILGGTLSCSNLITDGAYVDITQEGGSFVVGNLLMIAGYYPGTYGGFNAHPARFDFKDGTLTAPNIELTAQWNIASSTQAGRITNSGEFRFGGALIVGDAAEQFGRMILIDDSSINLSEGDAKLTFAASNAEPWNDQATLSITGWSGSLAGGGPDRVTFRGGTAGLTAHQLQQIKFVNPSGFPAGEYLAQILGTGEIVPAATRQISIQTNGGSLFVNWSDNQVLQGSNNVEGPYVDIATQPPYTADVNAYSRLFLRLRP